MGATSDRYRILAELGEGGMANVYLAVARVPSGSGKLVVLKAIKEYLALDPDLLSMFLAEARLAARLNHPNVVQTFEVAELGERPAIVMEYLEGQTLASVLANAERSAMPTAMKLRIFAAALEGLHYIHELTDADGAPLALVHRDVSPHNVFVTFDGQVKVLDFGIAKGFVAPVSSQADPLKGKIHYMAPEQMAGGEIDRRADIFSAGVLLWEIATGRRLWRGRSEVNVMHTVLAEGVPAPRSVEESVSEELNAVCVKALARAPGDRYATMAELLAAIDALLESMRPAYALKDVGKYLSETFSEERARANAIVEDELRKANAAEPSPALEKLPRMTWTERTLSAPNLQAAPITRTIDREPETTSPQTVTTPPPAPSKRWVAVAIAVMALSSAVAAATALRGHVRETDRAVASSPARLEAPVPEPARVSIPLESPASVPPDGSVTTDAEPARRMANNGLDRGSKLVVPSNMPRRSPPEARRTMVLTPASASAPAPVAAPPADSSNCSPPFTFDAQGIKRLKPECL